MKMPDLIFISKDGDVFKFDERVHDNPTHQATHIVEALRRENEELKAKLDNAKWQPIETAPRDGSRILTGKHHSVNWKTKIAVFVNGKFFTENNPYCKPTLWTQLPNTPEQR